MEAAAQEARRKRALEAAEASDVAKRTRLEPAPLPPTPPNLPSAVPTPVEPQASTSAFANFDFATLPLPLVVDILIANLSVLSDERLATAIAVSTTPLH